MRVYLVQTVRKSDDMPVLCAAEEVILYKTRAQADEFIRSLDKSEKYYHIVLGRTICDPHPVRHQTFDKDTYAIKSIIEDALEDHDLTGQYAKDVLQRAVAKWIAEYVTDRFDVAIKDWWKEGDGICAEIATEVEEEITKIGKEA